jgi:uncharacterized protein YuzE
MKIFKELKKLGYIHYSATTIEELDDLPLNSAERISEQALVLRWFRKKYELHVIIDEEIRPQIKDSNSKLLFEYTKDGKYAGFEYEEAELACLVKLIEIVKKQNLKG